MFTKYIAFLAAKDLSAMPIVILFASLAVIIASATVVFLVLVKIKTAARRRKIENYGRKSEIQTNSILKKAFSDNAVFSGIYLPYINNKHNKYAEIDHLVITRSGICVIEVKSHNGFIKCSDERYWWQTYNDKKISFYNPLWQNKTHIKIVGDILRSQGQYNVPIYSVVVFTSNRVTFSKNHENVIKADELVNYIKKHGKKNVLSETRTKRIRDIIKSSAAKDKAIARNHRSSMRSFNKKSPRGKYSR